MFDFSAENGTIRAYGPIGAYEGGIEETDFMEAFDNIGGDDVTIHLNSPGGSVDSGQSIYNQIQNYPGKVTVQVDSIAHSIASYFPMAADEVVINSNAQMLVHDPWAVAMGNAREFRGVAELLDVLGAVVADGYAERTGKSRDYWLSVMAEETIFTADQAVDVGLADRINKARSRNTNQQNAAAIATISPAMPKLKTKVAVQRLKLRRNGLG